MKRIPALLLTAALAVLPPLVRPASSLAQPPANEAPADKQPNRPAETRIPTVKDLERELADIEKELSALRQRVDVLLQDLVDPRITTLSVFFTAEQARDRIPLSLHILLNGRPLKVKEFSEIDRLILLKGGSLEIYTGIVDPKKQSLTFRCTLAPKPGEAGEDLAASTFTLEPARASKNFVEVTLGRAPEGKTIPLTLTARHWSKEPG